MNFSKLWILCDKNGINKMDLFSQLGMSSQTLNEMRKNGTVSLQTIDRICGYFNCQPNEIMEVNND